MQNEVIENMDIKIQSEEPIKELETPKEKEKKSTKFFDKYFGAYMTVIFVLLTNIGSLYVYDKFFTQKVVTVDMQELLFDKEMTIKFKNEEISELDFQKNVAEKVENIQKALLSYRLENRNTIFFIKGAVIDLKGFKDRNYKDITNEIKTTIHNYSPQK